jgi:hypothetical protein
VWVVVNESCSLKDAYPKVELEFTANGLSQYPFQGKRINSKRSGVLGIVQEQIKKNGTDANTDVQPGLFKYKVFLLNHSSQSATVPVLDPDLEVEPPL